MLQLCDISLCLKRNGSKSNLSIYIVKLITFQIIYYREGFLYMKVTIPFDYLLGVMIYDNNKNTF